MRRFQQSKLFLRSLFFLLLLLINQTVGAQENKTVEVSGTVYEYDFNDKLVELDFATVSFPDYAIGTTTNNGGHYVLQQVPVGKARIQVQYLGKLTIDTLVQITRNMQLNFTMQNDNFKLKEVTVIATNNRAGKSTSSSISRQAMDHLQATSLNDLMALMPGGMVAEPNLNNSQQLNIRQISGSGSNEEALNALGTAIIRDGAPVSNNSNLSALNPTVTAGTAAVGGGASAGGGMDVRSISTENIESVEVIRGIPSVEYGDLTSGAVIIHSKAGREPLRIKAKANPNVYQVSVGTGFELGGKRGSFNISGDYAYNRNEPTASYIHYQRATAKLLYSNVFFNNKLRSNTSFDFIYGENERDRNPDDQTNQTSSRGRDAGFTFNTNGTWSINKGWLKTLRYVASFSYTDKDSYRETSAVASYAPYSMTTTDGAVLSNFAGQQIYDTDGNQLTQFGPEDATHYAQYLDKNYLERYEIDSRELNAFVKLTANLFKHSGNINNRILLGLNFKTDGNLGEGKTYDPTAPPYRAAGFHDVTFRPRRYKDIPFINQFGAFAEENFSWSIGSTELNLQAGLRYDHTSVVGGVFSPRFNSSLIVVPNLLTIRGGYGITAKMPTLLYLYPEDAYFEYVNINELTKTNIPESDRLFMTTTKVYNTQNSALKVAKNHKAEVGFDLTLGKARLAVTAFKEKLKDGYMLNATFDTYKPFTVNEYTRNSDGQLVLSSSSPVISSFNTPTNNLSVENKGIEFDLNLGRIDAIRTSFQLNGSWLRSCSWNNGYDFYDNSSSAYTKRKNVAIYAPASSKSYRQRFVSTLRATHNLPKLGFVVTLTAQAVWQDANWKTFGNDSIPMGYLSVEDGSVNMFKPGQYTTTQQFKDAGLSYLLQTPNHSNAIKESYNPYFCFNLNVTKEIGDMMRVSFFANNMFRSYPRMESKRNPGTFVTMNNRFYFGLELSLTL